MTRPDPETPWRALLVDDHQIIRDGRRGFVGSQSLRKLELDERREVGIIVRERAVVRQLEKTFKRDWKQAQ